MNNKRVDVETLWASHKYEVMWHSHKHYLEIRELMKTNVTVVQLKNMIESARSVTPTTGSVMNTFDHMWGYFKKYATSDELAQYKYLKHAFLNGHLNASELLHFIRELSEKYDVVYLRNSVILKDR